MIICLQLFITASHELAGQGCKFFSTVFPYRECPTIDGTNHIVENPLGNRPALMVPGVPTAGYLWKFSRQWLPACGFPDRSRDISTGRDLELKVLRIQASPSFSQDTFKVTLRENNFNPWTKRNEELKGQIGRRLSNLTA